MNRKFGSVSRGSGRVRDYRRQSPGFLKTVIATIQYIFLVVLPVGVSAAPDIDELLNYLAMSATEKKLIFEGDMVSRDLEETSDNELSAGLAFVLPKSPKQLGQIFIGGSKMEMSEPIVAHGDLTPETTVSQLAGISFLHDESDEIDNYLNVGSGDTLNLDGKEMAAFNRLAEQRLVDVAAKVAVEKQLRTHLLNRYHAYRTGGLNAIYRNVLILLNRPIRLDDRIFFPNACLRSEPKPPTLSV